MFEFGSIFKYFCNTKNCVQLAWLESCARGACRQTHPAPSAWQKSIGSICDYLCKKWLFVASIVKGFYLYHMGVVMGQNHKACYPHFNASDGIEPTFCTCLNSFRVCRIRWHPGKMRDGFCSKWHFAGDTQFTMSSLASSVCRPLDCWCCMCVCAVLE